MLASYRRRPIPPIECTSRRFAMLRLLVDQAPEPLAERVRERFGEGGQENPGVRMRAGEMDGTVKRDDRLSCAG